MLSSAYSTGQDISIRYIPRRRVLPLDLADAIKERFEVFKDIKGHKLKMQYDERLLTREDALKAMGSYQDIVRRIITSSQGSLVGDVLASEYAT